MTSHKPFPFSQWRPDEILLHHRKYNSSGKPVSKRILNIQSICTIIPWLRFVDFYWKIFCLFIFGDFFNRQSDYFFSTGSRDIFFTNKHRSAENLFSVKIILTENFEPSVLYHQSEQNLEVAWYSAQAIPSEFTFTSWYRPANKSEEYNFQ